MSHAGREAERAEQHADRDTEQDADRRGVEEVIGEQTEKRAADDTSDEEAAEAEDVTTTQPCRLMMIGHRPKLSRRAGVIASGVEPEQRSRIAVVIVAAVLVGSGGRHALFDVSVSARERYHEQAVT